MSFGRRDSVASHRVTERISWAVLGVLVVVLLVSTLSFDRSDWPGLFGDEATYLMAAYSLALDGDLLFDRGDYSRFVSFWGLTPEGLILQSGDGGETITYGKPFLYPLVVVPFVWLAPVRGLFVANALMLSLTAMITARVMARRIGAAAPLWVAVAIFASVTFVYTFQAHADLFLLCCTALALSLIFDLRDEHQSGTRALRIVRWATVGGLLGAVVYSRPLYAPLVLALALLLPQRRRLDAVAGLALGAAALVGFSASVQKINGGAWTGYGGERRGFYSSTGYPGIDFPASDWGSEVGEDGNAAWTEAGRITRLPRTSLSLWSWNSIYLLVGRHVGLMPYYLPAILGLFWMSRRDPAPILLAAVLLCLAGFFLYRPFNFYGGGGAVANRYLLALYPVFWFLPSRRVGWGPLAIAPIVALPFLWPAWVGARQYPLETDRTYRFVSSVAERILPYETTQSHLKPAGRSDVVHNELWIKFLTPTLRPSRDSRLLLIDSGARGEFLVGSSIPVTALDLEVATADAEIDHLAGGSVTSDDRAGSHQALKLEFKRPRAKHRMWWSWNDVYIYRVVMQARETSEERVGFLLKPSFGERSDR